MTKRIRIFLFLSVLFLAGAVVFLIFFRPMVIPWKNSGEPSDGWISAAAQFPVYDKSCESVTLVIRNNSGEPVEFGRPWTLEKKVLGQWASVPFAEIAFTSEAICLQNGGTWAQNCYLTHFIGSIGDGEYRIVKEIGDGIYYAEFKIGESVITAETPFGHEKLENLSLDPDVIPQNTVSAEEGNTEELTAFLNAWYASGLRYQLRSAYRGDEGHMVIEDVTILADDKILWQADTRRAPNGRITQKYYSNIVTDGERLYLSDWNEYRSDGSERVLLNFTLPDDIAEQAVGIIGKAGQRDVTLSRWSKDGMYNGIIVRNEIGFTRYYENGGSAGQMISVDMNNLENPERMRYVDLQWTDDSNLMVMVLTDPGSASPWYYYEFINTDSGQILSHTFSFHEYQWVNDHIQIPE